MGTEGVLKVKKIFRDSELPEYVLSSDIGMDFRSYESVTIFPLEQKTIRTGVSVEIPEGYVGLIRDRAGIVSKMNVHTAAGTFDPGYRGEVSIVLVNLGETSVEIEKGMRIAQLVIIPAVRVQIKEVQSLSSSKRNDKGFGSTGMKEVVKELDKITNSKIYKTSKSKKTKKR